MAQWFMQEDQSLDTQNRGKYYEGMMAFLYSSLKKWWQDPQSKLVLETGTTDQLWVWQQ